MVLVKGIDHKDDLIWLQLKMRIWDEEKLDLFIPWQVLLQWVLFLVQEMKKLLGRSHFTLVLELIAQH